MMWQGAAFLHSPRERTLRLLEQALRLSFRDDPRSQKSTLVD